MRLSIAVPLLNEEDVVPELLARLRAVVAALPGGPHEVVIVDDGSTDGTQRLLAAACREFPGLQVIALSRNFGHQAAISAALDHVSGDAVVVMDGDLQDPPELIPDLVEAWRAGADVVFVVRRQRKAPWHLRLAYRAFYVALRRTSRVPIPVDSGDFALLSRRVVDQLRAMPERHRFLRGMRAWVGYRQQAIEVDRPERAGGTSKYSFLALLRLALDGLFAFSTWPIRAAMVLGALAVLAAIAFSIYATLVRLLTGTVPAGFTAILVVTVFLAGMNMLFLGIIGEYVGRVYDEVKQRPHYVVDQVFGERPRG